MISNKSINKTKTKRKIREQKSNIGKEKTIDIEKCLRTVSHGGTTRRRPFRNVTVKLRCSIKRCKNHYNITKKNKKKKKENITREQRKKNHNNYKRLVN